MLTVAGEILDMKHRILIVFMMMCTPILMAQAQNSGIPHLEKHGTAMQLFVDGKPFLMLGGELLNSSSSSLDYMRPVWPRLAAVPLNTVLTPLSWELIEPREGKFDFTLLDGLIQDGCGRDSGYPLPPAQTRAGTASAHGSYLGSSMAWRRSTRSGALFSRPDVPPGAHTPARLAHLPGAVSGTG
jgi:hypothetical protein